MAQPSTAAASRPIDLLVVGDINPDIVVRGVDLVPHFGQRETLVDAVSRTIGGSGAIVACGAARLGLRTAIVGCIGNDEFGRWMLAALADRGVDTTRSLRDPTRSTGATLVLAQPTDRAILTAPGAIAALKPDAVPDDTLAGARHVHVASLFLQPELQAGLAGLLARARIAGATTSLDTNWDPTGDWRVPAEAFPLIDLLLPNEEEALRLARRRDRNVSAAAHDLIERGTGTVAIKRGAAGALALTKDHTVRAAAVSVEPVDTIGAGDSFDAGLITGVLRGRSLDEALRLACTCGALSTRAVGGVDAQPTLAEADEQ
jgi:sugar/nucleoside kinase (ribokinase family)